MAFSCEIIRVVLFLQLQNNKNKTALEIERKFLVDSSKWKPVDEGTRITQAYLGLDPSPTVRIRIAGDKAFITIKGRSKCISRPEFEYESHVVDA